MKMTAIPNLSIHSWTGSLVLLAFVFLIPAGCQKNNMPTAVAKAGGFALSVSLPINKEIKSSLLGVPSDEVWYAVIGPNMAPVTGSAGPFSASSDSGEVDFSINLPQGPARLISFQLNAASNHQVLALGAAQVNVDSNTNNVWVTLGSVTRSCYVLDSSPYGGTAYVNFQGNSLSTTPAGSDMEVNPLGAGFCLTPLGNNSVAYLGTGAIVDFDTVPSGPAFSTVCSSNSKQASGASNIGLQTGDVYCMALGANGANGHAWLQVVNPTQPSGFGPSGPKLFYRYNASMPYYAYDPTTADASGSCPPTPTFPPTQTLTPTISPTLTPTFTFTASPTPSLTGTFTPTLTPSITQTPTITSTPTATSTFTSTKTSTPSSTSTASSTTTSTATLTNTPTPTASKTSTPSSTATQTPTITNTPTITATTTVTVTSISTAVISPRGIAVDSSGYVYISSSGGNMIRVYYAGAVTTLAGQLTAGYANNTGTAAQFSNPEGLAWQYGNVYVADTGNDVIRNINTSTGQVSTVAGSAGVTGATDGSTGSALFNLPAGIAADTSGDVYVADTGNDTIRYISGGAVSTLAGSAGVTGDYNLSGTSALFNAPSGLAYNGYALNGTLYIADAGNNMIRSLDLTTGNVTTVAGQLTSGSTDAIGLAASFNNPTGIAMDNIGNLYVADSGNNKIREINIATGQVTTLAGSGSPGSTDGSGYTASFDQPFGVAVNTAGTTGYVADTATSRIREILF